MPQNDGNKRSDFDYVSLFHLSVKEYQDVMDTLVKTTEKNKLTKLKVQMMMLRKYITNGENVQIKYIIPKIQALLPNRESEIKQGYAQFDAEINKTMIHVNARGEEQDVRSVFNDVVYGYYLHADFDRVERLRQTDQTFLWEMIDRFVISIEDIIYKLNNIIIEEMPAIAVDNQVLQIEPVIRYGDVPDSKKNKLSGVWSNLVADEITESGLEEHISMMSDDDLTCYLKSVEFLDELSGQTMPSIERMSSIVLEEKIQDWGDFKSVREAILNLKDYGLSTKIDYSEDNCAAWVKVFREVGDGFVVSNPQQVRVEIITLCRNLQGEWRVFAFGGKADPIK